MVIIKTATKQIRTKMKKTMIKIKISERLLQKENAEMAHLVTFKKSIAEEKEIYLRNYLSSFVFF